MLDFLTLTDFLIVLAIAAIGLVVAVAFRLAEKRRKNEENQS